MMLAKNRVTGLRSLLRFLRLEGLVDADLAAAVPPGGRMEGHEAAVCAGRAGRVCCRGEL